MNIIVNPPHHNNNNITPVSTNHMDLVLEQSYRYNGPIEKREESGKAKAWIVYSMHKNLKTDDNPTPENDYEFFDIAIKEQSGYILAKWLAIEKTDKSAITAAKTQRTKGIKLVKKIEDQDLAVA